MQNFTIQAKKVPQISTISSTSNIELLTLIEKQIYIDVIKKLTIVEVNETLITQDVNVEYQIQSEHQLNAEGPSTQQTTYIQEVKTITNYEQQINIQIEIIKQLETQIESGSSTNIESLIIKKQNAENSLTQLNTLYYTHINITTYTKIIYILNVRIQQLNTILRSYLPTNLEEETTYEEEENAEICNTETLITKYQTQVKLITLIEMRIEVIKQLIQSTNQIIVLHLKEIKGTQSQIETIQQECQCETSTKIISLQKQISAHTTAITQYKKIFVTHVTIIGILQVHKVTLIQKQDVVKGVLIIRKIIVDELKDQAQRAINAEIEIDVKTLQNLETQKTVYTDITQIIVINNT